MKSGDAITSEQIAPEGEYPVFGGGGLRGYTSSFTHEGEYALIGRQGALCGNVNYGTGKFWASEHAVVVAPRRSLDTRWLGETLRTMNLNQYSVSAAQPGLSVDSVSRLEVAVPPLTEQHAISTFLDRETAKIDALIAEQERLVALLSEKRQAVITHAVTKGLDPTVPMKDSGVEWIGEVPADWKVPPLRQLARLESGHTPSRQKPEWWRNCTIPWFTLSDIWQVREEGREVIHETSERVSELGLANSSARLLPEGTVMLSRTASVGFAAVMGQPMATSQDFANWVCGPDLSPSFLLRVFQAMTPEFERLKFGSTHNTIYMPDIAAFRCPAPPRPEQERIVAYLQDELNSIRTLRESSLQAIDLLRERRSALVSAAVTGRVDVRGLVEAEPA